MAFPCRVIHVTASGRGGGAEPGPPTAARDRAPKSKRAKGRGLVRRDSASIGSTDRLRSVGSGVAALGSARKDFVGASLCRAGEEVEMCNGADPMRPRGRRLQIRLRA